jgi:hypothetical protein
MTSPSASVTSARPVQSMPPDDSPGASSMPNQRDDDRRDGQDDVHVEAVDDRAAGEGADDDGQLERADQHRGSATGQQSLTSGVARAAVDDRDLERQPDDRRALQGPADQERREARRDDGDPRAERRDGRREHQHLLVPDQVAESGEQRDRERRDDQLSRLEPVDVAFGDVEVLGDLRVDRGVVALQHPAGDLDRDEEADDGTESLGGGLAGRRGHAGSLSISRRYHRTPSKKAWTPRCSS